MSSAPKKLFFLPRLCDKNEAISFSVIFSMNIMRRGSINSNAKSTFWSSAPALCCSQSLQTVLGFSNFLSKLRKTWMNFRAASLKLTLDVAILGTVYHLHRVAAQVPGYPYLSKIHWHLRLQVLSHSSWPRHWGGPLPLHCH